MNNYRNTNRPGIRTTATADPKAVMEDISYAVKQLSPEATPVLSIMGKIGKGAPPKGKKIWVAQEHLFDDVDFCSHVTFSEDGMSSANWKRYAVLTLDQVSRPDTNQQMYYSPQDVLYLVETDQTVEVVATPVASIRIGLGATDFWSFDQGLLGDTPGTNVNRTHPGTVLVRNVEPYAMQRFVTSHVIFMGRTIFESQDIEAVPKQRDFIWDCNYVEHKEAVVKITEDQADLIQMHSQVPDFTHQQRAMINEFKKEIERKIIFGHRGIDTTVAGYPKYFMDGVLNTIKTNVAYYDKNIPGGPEFEKMVQWFMYEQAFRYNPGGTQKIAYAGGKFMMKFQQAFASYRRTNSLKVSGDVGFKIDSYNFMGNELGLVRYEGFRQGTDMENWCLVIDPSLMVLRTKKDFNTRPFDLPNQRIKTLMVEWQGTVSFQLEQAHALLKTA